MIFLYYAGLCSDLQTEQIGLAISSDGKKFERVNNNGLVLPINRSSNWMSCMTCNPAVMKINEEKFIMFFQGIVKNPRKTTIGLSESLNGIDWKSHHPIISLDDKNISLPLEAEKYSTKDLIEPTVIYDEGIFKMWFISRGDNEVNNRLHYAESKNVKSWQIKKTDILKNKIAPNFLIFYPEVIKTGNRKYNLFLTLRDKFRFKHSICEYTSQNGLEFNFKKKILPNFFDIKRIDFANLIKIPKVRGVVATLVEYSLKKISPRDYYGYSHSCHYNFNNDKRLVYHSYHYDSQKKFYMDIGSFDVNSKNLNNKQTILSVNFNKDEWDAGTVADPFILKI